MSDSSILDRFTATARLQRPAPSDASAPEPDADASDDLGCFGYLRGQRERAVMLELRRRTGEVMAVAYGYVERIGYDPSEGITLHLGGQKVVIRGTNLNAEVRPNVRLFEGLTRHRVGWVRESPQPLAMSLDSSPNVTGVDW